MTTPAHSPELQALAARYREQERRGELRDAVQTLAEIIRRDGRALWAYNALTRHLFTAGQRAEAEQVARAALRAGPEDADAHHLFGTILSENNDLPAGEWHFRRALELGGDRARALANLGLNLMQQGRTDESDACFEDATKLAPGEMVTWAHWAKLQEVRGDVPRAWALLERAQAISSPEAVNLLRAAFLSREGRHAEALAIIDAAGQLGGSAQLERGRLCDRLGRYDEAWRDFVEGKRKLAAEGGGLAYQADAVRTFFARLEKFFVRQNIGRLPRSTRRAATPQPLFVLGFPRSGTTLIEQVLCSHSAVRAGGELSFIAELRHLTNQLFAGPEPFPENLARTWTADHRYAATVCRDYYFARAEGYGLTAGEHRFFVDKMPFNEVYLPLIRMAFPESPIVTVVRHPLDVCVSMMANNMTHGFNCGYRIDDVVQHLTAVARLVEHYRREMAVGDYVLRYESFVGDQQSETARLLDCVGLPFEPACLSFHENRRYAPTPSYAQVTERLHARSVERHRRYERQLAPFLPQLAPLIAAGGYAA